MSNVELIVWFLFFIIFVAPKLMDIVREVVKDQ